MISWVNSSPLTKFHRGGRGPPPTGGSNNYAHSNGDGIHTGCSEYTSIYTSDMPGDN